MPCPRSSSFVERLLQAVSQRRKLLLKLSRQRLRQLKYLHRAQTLEKLVQAPHRLRLVLNILIVPSKFRIGKRLLLRQKRRSGREPTVTSTPPISAACQGCHDDKATASHALANTTVLGESCAACHSAGEEFSVDRVHQRIF